MSVASFACAPPQADPPTVHPETRTVIPEPPPPPPPAPEPPPPPPEPGELAAQAVLARAQSVVERRLAMRVPDVVFEATQHIHLAAWSGEIAMAPTVPGEVSEKVKEKALGRRRRVAIGELSIFFQKTAEPLVVQLYDAQGKMRPEAYVKLSRHLVDTSSPRVDGSFPWVAYHPRLFAMLYFVGQKFNRQLLIVSAYRAPARASRKRSYHTRGSAVDFTIRDKKRQKILAYVENSFTNVGVGWYPNSTFIHLDAREKTYYWVDRSGPGERQRTRRRKITRKPRRGTDPLEHTVHISPVELYRRR